MFMMIHGEGNLTFSPPRFTSEELHSGDRLDSAGRAQAYLPESPLTSGQDPMPIDKYSRRPLN